MSIEAPTPPSTQRKKVGEACPNPQQLMAFSQGRLPNPKITSIENHLAACSPCVETLIAFDHNDTISDLARKMMSRDTPAQGSSLDGNTIERIANQLKQFGGAHLLGTAADEIQASTQQQINQIESCFDPIPARSTTGSDADSSLREEGIGMLGSYRIETILGCGSSGVVYRAYDTELDRTVAIKILRPMLGQKARTRFIQEAKATASINAPNVVSVYHVGTHAALAYIVMQWTPGETLQRKLARDGKLPPDRVRSLAIQIARGLDQAHRSGLIHRDIKPANLWLEPETGGAKILDLGLVRAAEFDLQLTCTGMIAGTPCYMSPEQASGKKLDFSSDFFSLGCVLYESLTGKLPFLQDNLLATIQSILNDDIEGLADCSDTPEDLAILVDTLLAKNVDDRPPNAAAIVHALENPVADWEFVPVLRPGSMSVDQPAANSQSATKELKSSGRRMPFWRGAAFVLLGLGAMVAAWNSPQIIRIMTDQGQLVIETSDPDIKIEIVDDGGNVRIIDLKTEQAIDIKSGLYSIKPLDDANGIEVSQSSIVMTRGGKEIVKVTRKETAIKKRVENASGIAAAGEVQRSKARQNPPSNASVATGTTPSTTRSIDSLLANDEDYGHRLKVVTVKPEPGKAADVGSIRAEIQLQRKALKRLVKKATWLSRTAIDTRGLRRADAVRILAIENSVVEKLANTYDALPDRAFKSPIFAESVWLKHVITRYRRSIEAVEKLLRRVAILDHELQKHESTPGDFFKKVRSKLREQLEQDYYYFQPESLVTEIDPDGELSLQFDLGNSRVSEIDAYWIDWNVDRRQYFDALKQLNAMQRKVANVIDKSSQDDVATANHHVERLKRAMDSSRSRLPIEHFQLKPKRPGEPQDLVRRRAANTLAETQLVQWNPGRKAPIRSTAASSGRGDNDDLSIKQMSSRMPGNRFDCLGHCFDAKTSAQLPDARVRLFLVSGDKRTLVSDLQADDKGRFSFRDLAYPDDLYKDFYLILVTREGKSYTATLLNDEIAHRVEIKNGYTGTPVKMRNFFLKEGVTVSGRIVDHKDKAVAGMDVYNYRIGGEFVDGVGHAKTDSQGRFKMENTFSVTPVIHRENSIGINPVHLSHPDYGELQFTVTDPADKRTAFDLKLPRAVAVTGTVIDHRSGKPAIGVELGIQECRSSPSQRQRFPTQNAVEYSGWSQLTTDDTGVYRVVLPAGIKYNIFVINHVPSEHVAAAVEVDLSIPRTAENDVKLKAIELTKPVAVSGRVIDSDGNLVTETSLGWHGPDRPSTSAGIRSTDVDHRGRFTAQVMPGQNSFYVNRGMRRNVKLRYRTGDTWHEVTRGGQSYQRPMAVSIDRDIPIEIELIVK